MKPEIDAGAFQRAVTQKISDRLDADALFEKTHRKRMAQAIGGGVLKRESALPGAFFVDIAYGRMLDGAFGCSCPKKKFRTGTVRSTASEVPPEHPEGFFVQGQDQGHACFLLDDPQRSGGPIDGVEPQGGDFRGAQSIMDHEIKDGVVPPSGLSVPVDRTEQPLNQRPRDGPGKKLLSIDARRVDKVQSILHFSAVMTEAEKRPEACDGVLQALTRQMLPFLDHKLLDRLGCQIVEGFSRRKGALEKGQNGREVLFDR